MSETTARKLSDFIPAARPAGDLPSVRTYSQQRAALESDDINEVKGQLAHVWSHYQSLEFMLAGAAHNLEAIDNVWNDETVEHDVTREELILGFFGAVVTGVAYHTAHEGGQLGMLLFGGDVQEGLKQLYSHLDFEPTPVTIPDTLDL